MPSDTAFTLDETGPETVADTMVSELPEPQQHAIDEAQRESAATGADVAVDVDALGIPWNPEVHATGADGKGVRTQKGTWRKRRGIHGTASVLNTPSAAKAAPADAPPDPEVERHKANELACRQGGMMAARLLVNISVGIGGEDFIPRKLSGPGGVEINELQTLEQAFGDYFVAKDIGDLPPGWMLVGVLSMYYLPRFQMPKTQQRAKGFFAWCKAKWASWRLRKHGLKVVPKEEPRPMRRAPEEEADPMPGVEGE